MSRHGATFFYKFIAGFCSWRVGFDCGAETYLREVIGGETLDSYLHVISDAESILVAVYHSWAHACQSKLSATRTEVAAYFPRGFSKRSFFEELEL